MKGTRVIYQSKNCCYVKPPLLLAPFIAHYTFQFGHKNKAIIKEADERTLTVLPDASGCIVMDYNGHSLSSYVWGPTTKAVLVGDDRFEMPLRMFVEFLPGGLGQFIPLNQEHITDCQFPLAEVSKALEKELKNLIEIHQSLEEIIQALDSILLNFFDTTYQKQANTILTLMPYLKKSRGIVTVKGLLEYTAYSSRHLNRLFNENLGVNAKTYLRLIRVNNAIKQMKKETRGLTEMTQLLGYYDQAHFIHDFKSVVGVSPKAYLENMSGFYNEDYKF